MNRIGLIGIAVHEAFKAAHTREDPSWTQPGIVSYWRRLNEKRNE